MNLFGGCDAEEEKAGKKPAQQATRTRSACAILSPSTVCGRHARISLSTMPELPRVPQNMSAVEVKDLWFSYEVAQNISSTAKLDLDVAEYGKAAKGAMRTADGGLSVDQPRRQHDGGMELVYKLQLAGINMSLPMGGRCMLVGANGAGKTTLMSVIGGKHMCNEAAVRVLGRAAFEDTTLSKEIALLTGNWTHTVSFVGHNVPFQAMEVSRLIESNSVGVDPARTARLVKLLEIDPKWNLTTVSDGQRRRVQILCKVCQRLSGSHHPATQPPSGADARECRRTPGPDVEPVQRGATPPAPPLTVAFLRARPRLGS